MTDHKQPIDPEIDELAEDMLALVAGGAGPRIDPEG